MKILITGGTGHLGSALIHHLVRDVKTAPENIRVFYLRGTPTNALGDIRGLDFFSGNILNENEVRAACEGVRKVFHMVGLTTFDPRQKRKQWLVNVEGTRNILEAVRNSATVEKLCYTSTVNVLAPPFPEGSIGTIEGCDPYAGLNRLHSFKSRAETLEFIEGVRAGKIPNFEEKIGLGYHDSKLAAQELVDDYVRRFGLNAVSLLPGTMFGPYDYLVGTGMYLLSLYRGEMPAVLRGGLSASHVMDVAEGHWLAMEKAEKGTRSILSGRDEDNYFFKDLCAVIVDVLREKFPDRKFRAPRAVIPVSIALGAAFVSEHHSRLLKRPMLLSRDAVNAGAVPLFYSSKESERAWGYRPKRTFRAAVAEMIDYYRRENLFEAGGRYVDRVTPNPS